MSRDGVYKEIQEVRGMMIGINPKLSSYKILETELNKLLEKSGGFNNLEDLKKQREKQLKRKIRIKASIKNTKFIKPRQLYRRNKKLHTDKVGLRSLIKKFKTKEETTLQKIKKAQNQYNPSRNLRKRFGKINPIIG